MTGPKPRTIKLSVFDVTMIYIILYALNNRKIFDNDNPHNLVNLKEISQTYEDQLLMMLNRSDGRKPGLKRAMV